MGVYVCVISKTKRDIKSIIESRLAELEENLNTDFRNRYIYSSDNGSAVLVDFAVGSKILDADKEFYVCDEGALTIQGNLLPKAYDIQEMDFINAEETYNALRDNDIENFRDSFIGDYSIVKLCSDSRVYAVNDRLSAENVFYSEDGEYIYISNRIRFIRILRQKSTVNLTTLSNICLMGYSIGTETSINEIERLPQGSYISIYNGRLSIFGNELFFWNDKTTKFAMSEFRIFFQNEITACANRIIAYVKKGNTLNIGLSGGKDSRALVSMIMKAGYKNQLTLFTNGYETHPDVTVAKMISEHYNIPHKINITKPGAIMSKESYFRKLKGSVFQTDGMIGLFNAKGNEQVKNDRVDFYTNEVFRGYAHNRQINTFKEASDYFKTIHLFDPLDVMNPELKNYFSQMLEERTKKMADAYMTPKDAVDSYYICDRLPNWNGYLARTDNYANPQISIMNNDALIKAFWQPGMADERSMELCHFLTMTDFDPWLAECPFAEQVWDSRLKKYSGNIKINSEKVPLPEGIPMHGSWQHLISNSPEVKNEMAEILSSFDNSEIWTMYKKDKIINAVRNNTFSYTPMISIYGFINMFFYYHQIEVNMKLIHNFDN